MINPALAPHQAEAVTKLGNGKILKGGVGTGKSRTAMAYFVQSDLPPWVPLYIITTAKKRDSGDWQDEAKEWGIAPTVDSWNNLEEYEDVQDAFFIFDEQRVVGSGVWVKAFLKVTQRNRWILLSATPGDTWLDYCPVFIANGFYRNRSEFTREHVVYAPYSRYPKVQRYIETSRLERQLRSILVEMPYERTTVRHLEDVYCEYDKDQYSLVTRKRWNYLEERPIRSVPELFSLAKRVTNSDPTRLERCRELMAKHKKLIIFYNFDYELALLRTLDREKAEWNGHKHDAVPDSECWLYLVQYSAGGEGWNCTATDAMVFYSMQYSYRVFEQSQGRIDRMDTPFVDLWYYVLRCGSPIDNGISAALGKKQNFNEAAFLRYSV